ncbi:MAG: hypothetical protein AAFZ80_09730 [Cyanobacteria bacterium P01_A01_bin.105]
MKLITHAENIALFQEIEVSCDLPDMGLSKGFRGVVMDISPAPAAAEIDGHGFSVEFYDDYPVPGTGVRMLTADQITPIQASQIVRVEAQKSAANTPKLPA